MDKRKGSTEGAESRAKDEEIRERYQSECVETRVAGEIAREMQINEGKHNARSELVRDRCPMIKTATRPN